MATDKTRMIEDAISELWLLYDSLDGCHSSSLIVRTKDPRSDVTAEIAILRMDILHRIHRLEALAKSTDAMIEKL